MARALGEDLRLRVVKAAGRGASARQVAARFGVGMIEERKDITLNEMVARLEAERSMRIGCVDGDVRRDMKAMGNLASVSKAVEEQAVLRPVSVVEADFTIS